MFQWVGEVHHCWTGVGGMDMDSLTVDAGLGKPPRRVGWLADRENPFRYRPGGHASTAHVDTHSRYLHPRSYVRGTGDDLIKAKVV